MSEILEGTYRCSECGHGKRLYACSLATVSGRLLPDGTVTESDTTQTELFVSSIDCEDHPLPGHRLEQWIDGQWTYWETCAWVGENGRACVNGTVFVYRQSVGDSCDICEGRGGFSIPVREVTSMARDIPGGKS